MLIAFRKTQNKKNVKYFITFIIIKLISKFWKPLSKLQKLKCRKL